MTLAQRNVLIEGPKQDSVTERIIRPLRSYEATTRAFDAAERELVSTIGVPICVSSCGMCCQMQTPLVWEVEAKFISSFLLGESTEYRDTVLALCEGWLLDRNPLLKTYRISGILTQEQWDKLRPEVNLLLGVSGNLPCPLLTADKLCSIHGARPLPCRAYGVTHVPSPLCPRPLSKMESADSRAHISENSQIGQKLVRMVGMTLKDSHTVGMMGCMFLPAALYASLRPDKYGEILHLIATAKTVILNQNPSILFQSQVNKIWSQSTKGGDYVGQ